LQYQKRKKKIGGLDNDNTDNDYHSTLLGSEIKINQRWSPQS